MNIAIFCSANSGIDPHFFQLTEELGTWLAENGHTVVFGGCDMGLMECVARAAHDAGGRTMGMIPAKVEERGHVSKYVDVEFRCDNLSDRKDLMLAHSDVLIALPGGIGYHRLSRQEGDTLQYGRLLAAAHRPSRQSSGPRAHACAVFTAHNGGRQS